MPEESVKYQDRVAVVSGAGSGIGRALTLALTRNGAHVAASDINRSGLAETQAACPPGSVTTYQLDVADRDAVLAHADDVRRDLGPASLLFNNAGVDLFAGVADMSWKDFDWLVGINIGGVVNGTKAFLPQLIESGTPRRPARLVNLSSAFGLIAVPYQGAYSTSKFAVRGFTEALRQEMLVAGHPVRVSCVHPGGVKTNIARAARTDRADAADLADRFERIAQLTPEKAARIILRGVERDSPRIHVGLDAWALDLMQRLLGSAYQQLVYRGAKRELQ
jgi:NAD(P)-dependent dehydrogenase (short-subunit alcohol dehydrogenase family)